MTDRVYPASKPTPNGNGAATTTANPTFPATKAQLYGATRSTYRPQPHHRRSRRRCTFCFWLILILLILLLLIGVAGSVFYVIYRPQRPSFTVTSLKLSYLNLTSSSTLNSKFDINITAKNPNNHIVFVYKPTTISILSGDIDVGDGTIPSFKHNKKNTTLLKASILSKGQTLESDEEGTLKTSLKSKSGFPVKVKLDTKVKAKLGNMKSPNVGITIICNGIKVHLPAEKKPAAASTSNAKCEADVRFKIWKWTF